MARLTPSSRKTDITKTSGAQSTTVDIPSGATFAIIGFLYYNGTGPESTVRPSSVTLDGQTATFIDGAGDNSTYYASLYKVSGFSTGSSKTLAYTLSATGFYFVMNCAVEYQDGTPTYGAHGAGSNSAGTAQTASLANSSGDLILSAYIVQDRSGSPTLGTGQTRLDETDDTTGQGFYGFTTETGSGTGDVQSVDNGDLSAIASTVITVSTPPTPINIAWIRA